jgi:hypothetical protein
MGKKCLDLSRCFFILKEGEIVATSKNATVITKYARDKSPIKQIIVTQDKNNGSAIIKVTFEDYSTTNEMKWNSYDAAVDWAKKKGKRFGFDVVLLFWKNDALDSELISNS